MPKILWSIPILVLLLFGLSSPAHADDGWETSLTVSISNAENRLSFGERTDAKDDIDGKYDVPAMLSGDIEAYFVTTETSLWRDIKAINEGMKKTWRLKIESPLEGKDVVLKWSRAFFPAGASVILSDPSAGKTVDMTRSERYTYVNTGSRDITIDVVL